MKRRYHMIHGSLIVVGAVSLVHLLEKKFEIGTITRDKYNFETGISYIQGTLSGFSFEKAEVPKNMNISNQKRDGIKIGLTFIRAGKSEKETVIFTDSEMFDSQIKEIEKFD